MCVVWGVYEFKKIIPLLCMPYLTCIFIFLKKSLQKEHIAKHLQSAVDGAGLTEGEDMEQECIPLGDMSGEH